jgi:hypothetical protein
LTPVFVALRRAVLAASLIGWAVAAGPAVAAEGLYLSWDDCAQGPTATSNLNFACDTNAGQSELYCAFTMPQAADNVVAIEVVVDIQHANPTLPDWWRLDTGVVGGCRKGSLGVAVDFPGKTACADMWQGLPTASGVQDYVLTEPRGALSQARIEVAASVLPQDAFALDGTSMYYAARIIINNARTIGAPTCGGCDQPACLVLNSILVGRLPGSPGGNYFLQTPGTGDGNWGRWQGGLGADCAAVPVRNRTWGQIKSLYR